MSDKGIYVSYQRAGTDFLAVRLGRIFTKIKTDEDRILHNDMVKDVLAIVRHDEIGFFRSMAGKIFYLKVNRRKRLMFRLAGLVLNIGRMKG